MKKKLPFASWIVVVGDRKKHLTALIVVKNQNEPLQVPVDDIE